MTSTASNSAPLTSAHANGHPDRSALATALDDARITGNVATPREGNLSHIHRFLAQERSFHFGVELTREWDYDSVFALMVEKVGIVADPAHTSGQDTISAQKCLDASGRMARVIGEVARGGGRILFATGHPAGMLPVHQALAHAAELVGAQIVRVPGTIENTVDGGDLRQLRGTWIWHLHGGIPHTHFPDPMELLLAEIERRGEALPDLVVADHGWAGHAATRGLRTVGFADCNDPALFVAEAQGTLEVAVPLDDDVVPQLYLPLVEFMLAEADLPTTGLAI
ncbi:phosphatase [Brevibacterium samyangense]|uniref:Phosphatase n=1 Tax=Brevibacterium samyangense TaxID=366888 RepID=A0ABN2TMQ3_9MICO